MLSMLLLSCSHSSVSSYSESDQEIVSALITSKQISEASGIAVSKTNLDTIWINNDSGNSASVFAVDEQGKQKTQLDIIGVNNIDWEDLAIFEIEGRSYILIADVGDNQAKRKSYQLDFVREPDFGHAPFPSHLSIKPEWSITYNYEDGPRDCESVAVDVANQQILLLSKREEIPVLYQLPLRPEKPSDVVATKLGAIKPFPRSGQRFFRLLDLVGYTHQPTGMDIASDGSAVVVLTYGMPITTLLKRILLKRILFQKITIGFRCFLRNPSPFPFLNSGKQKALVLTHRGDTSLWYLRNYQRLY